MAQMKKSINLTQGDVFLLLCKKDKRNNTKLAEAFGYHVKTLSKLIRMERLPSEAIERASRVFGVDPSVFDTGELLRAVHDLGAATELNNARLKSQAAQTKYLEKKVEAVEADNQSCKAQIEALKAEIAALTEENVFLKNRHSHN